MVDNMRRKIRGKKDPGNRLGVFPAWLLDPFKKPEKIAQRNPGEEGWTCCYCGKEEHLKRNCPQASKLSMAPCPDCKGPYWKRDCPLRCRPQGSDSQDNWD